MFSPLIVLVFVISLHSVASNHMAGFGSGGSSSSASIYSEITANEHRFSGTPLSYVNEYLCQKTRGKQDGTLDRNVEQLRRVAHALKEHQTSAKIKDKIRSKVDVLVAVIDINKSRPGDLCEVEGQDLMQLADLEVKLLLDDQNSMPKEARGCLAIKAIVDHLNERRRSICPNYMTELVLNKVSQMEAESLRRVIGCMDPFMELIMEPLGGYTTSTCSLPLDRLQFTNRQAGEALVKGLRQVLPDDHQLSWPATARDTTGEDEERNFLQTFAGLRNDYLVKPCEYFTGKLENRITTVRLYKSLYSSYESEPEFKSSKSPTNTSRFHRAWAFYNTCQLLLKKLPVVSISLLQALGYDLADSRLDNKQIYELIR